MNGRTSTLKRKILLRLAENERIFELIDNKKINKKNPDDLINVNIFPFLKIDYTVQEAGTYIGIKIDYPELNSNIIFKNTRLTVLIVSANRHLRAASGDLRTDLISEEILNSINWNDCFGFEVRLVSDREDPLNENFYYRKLVFESVSPNSMKNGVKIN